MTCGLEVLQGAFCHPPRVKCIGRLGLDKTNVKCTSLETDYPRIKVIAALYQRHNAFLSIVQ